VEKLSETNETKEVLTLCKNQTIPGFEHNGNIWDVSKHGSKLAIKFNDEIHIYDVSAEQWKVVTIIKNKIKINNIALYEDRIVLSGDVYGERNGELSIHNVSDGSVLFECEHSYASIGLDLKDNDLFLAHNGGITHLNIENGLFTDVGFVPQSKDSERIHGMYGGYGKDVVISDNYVYINGRHVGVNVFKREQDNQLAFIKRVGPRYTPTKMEWLKTEETLLLLGDAHVLVVDVTNPEKPKSLPTVSFKKGEVELGLWDGDKFLALIEPISQDKKMKLAAIDLATTPTLLDEYIFTREDRARPQAIVLNDKRLTIIYSDTMSVFEYAGFSNGHSEKFETAIKALRSSEYAPEISSILDALSALNKKVLVKSIASELEKSFKAWTKSNPEDVLESVNFEWPGHVASPPDYDAEGYATSNGVNGLSFYGIEVDFAYEIVDQLGTDNEELDDIFDELQGIADDFTYSVVREAFEIAVKSNAFKKLKKEDALNFTMNSHDDGPIEVYNYLSSK